MTASDHGGRVCAECGATYAARSNRAKYCDTCGPMVKARQAAFRQAKRREKLRGRRPPMGPDEAQINRECDQIELAWGWLRLRQGAADEELLIEYFPDGRYRIEFIGHSKAGSDLGRLGRHDEISRQYGTEKLIADRTERREALSYLAERLAHVDEDLRRILRNATRRGRRRRS